MSQIPEQQHGSSEEKQCDSESSASEVGATLSDQLTQCEEQPERSIIPYPAPLPKFTETVERVLMSGNKSKVMRIYNDIVKEAMMFYANSIPSETARTKISIANIGRSMIECYPVLECLITRNHGVILMTNCPN